MKKKKMARKIEWLEEACRRLGREVDCAEDYGHDYEFVGEDSGFTAIILTPARNSWMGFGDNGRGCAEFTYKCSRCGRTVNYTWDELSTKEKNALETLGVVKD